MHTRFNGSHVDTICKLKALADKHGMRFRFGVEEFTKVERDLSLIDNVCKDFNVVGDSLSDHYEDIIDGEIMYTEYEYWLELYDPKPNEKYGEYHSLRYIRKDVAFRLKDEWEDELHNYMSDNDDNDDNDDENDENDENEDKPESEEDKSIKSLIKFIEDNHGDGWNGVTFNTAPTEISGFGNKELITDGRCYREGMALHFFAELVCNYLNEPMIYNTY